MTHRVSLALATAITCVACGVEQPAEQHTPAESEAAARALAVDPVPSADPPVDRLDALVDCPQNDVPWSEAFLQARREKRLDELRQLTERLGRECPDHWQPRWILGRCLRTAGRKLEAAPPLIEGLEIARRAGDPVGVARTAHRLAWLSIDAARYEEAERHLEEALDAARRAERPGLTGHNLNTLAIVLAQRGDLGRVAGLMADAVVAFEERGWHRMARRVRFNQVSFLLDMGDAASTLEILPGLYEQAVADGDDVLIPAVAVALGMLHVATRSYDEALPWFDRVPPQAGRERAFADFELGRIALHEGRLDDARHYLDRVVEQEHNPVVSSLGASHVAAVILQGGDADAALRHLEPVIARADEMEAKEAAWVSRWIAGKAHLARGSDGEAIAALREAVEILDHQGEELDPLGNGLRFLSQRHDPYAELASALRGDRIESSADSNLVEVLQTMEKTHARALRRVLGDVAAMQADLELAALQRHLGEDELVLNYLIGEDRGTVLAVRRDAVLAAATPGWRDLGPPLRRYRSALTRPLRSADARARPMADLERSLEDGRMLSRALLGPVAPLLRDVERIYVVPDRELALLSFPALPWPVTDDSDALHFLGETIETALLPMTGAPPEWPESHLPMLLAGDPVPDSAGEFPALPGAREELQALARLWGASDTDLLQGEALSRAALLDRPLSSYRGIHLATHAVASTADPRGCAVYLSEGERLDVESIVDLSLDASPLVVLSACRTGEGELVPGEGVIGLGWAFLRAGARGVVASLWSVEDESATELMLAFYRGMHDGLDPVKALHRARRERARHDPHPAFWAPFVLVARPEAPTARDTGS